MKKVVLYCMCMVVSVAVDGAVAHDIETHRNFLVRKFDTSRWKTYWSEDTWHIRCLFTDINGDGVDDLIACSTSEEEDPTGYVWRFWLNDAKAGLVPVRRLQERVRWLCHPESFFKMAYDNGAQDLIGLGMNAGYTEGEFSKMVKATPDCVFRVDGNSYRLCELTPDVDTVFTRNGPRYLERLYAEWYFGYEFKPPKNVPHSPYLLWPPYTQPKGDLRLGGGIGEPDGFAVFVDRYRRAKKVRSPEGVKTVTVYVVFLDADSDGFPDFYITSDLDKSEDGSFSWDLYVRRGEVYSKVEDVIYPIPSRKELCALSPVVRASKDAFCRVVRFDVAPIFLIADGACKNQVRDAIMNAYAHRIEKLPCQTYHDRDETK